MDLTKQLNKIEEHFSNITPKELKQNLVNAGYGQIEPSYINVKQDKVGPGWWALAMSLRMLVKKDGIEREEIEGQIKELLDYFYHQ